MFVNNLKFIHCRENVKWHAIVFESFLPLKNRKKSYYVRNDLLENSFANSLSLSIHTFRWHSIFSVTISRSTSSTARSIPFRKSDQSVGFLLLFRLRSPVHKYLWTPGHVVRCSKRVIRNLGHPFPSSFHTIMKIVVYYLLFFRKYKYLHVFIRTWHVYMKHFTIYMLLIIFAIMFGISLSTDDCYYRGMHLG
jgi:hypothetical protein